MFVNFIICLKSVTNLFDELIKTKELDFSLRYEISQDPLEMFFTIIRKKDGFNKHTTLL